MLLIPDAPALQRCLAALPLATYKAGETVLAAGSRTGRLLFLKNGAVAVVRQGIEIAWSAKPGMVFGEISALLNRPHTADVRALVPSEFHVADAAGLLAKDTVVLLYVAAVLAERLDVANQAFLNLKKASGLPTL
jgi:CRP/FNR family transcriptional regulator, cyclic AMP receptor protein